MVLRRGLKRAAERSALHFDPRTLSRYSAVGGRQQTLRAHERGRAVGAVRQMELKNCGKVVRTSADRLSLKWKRHCRKRSKEPFHALRFDLNRLSSSS
jgi:hypothetical protein